MACHDVSVCIIWVFVHFFLVYTRLCNFRDCKKLPWKLHDTFSLITQADTLSLNSIISLSFNIKTINWAPIYILSKAFDHISLVVSMQSALILVEQNIKGFTHIMNHFVDVAHIHFYASTFNLFCYRETWIWIYAIQILFSLFHLSLVIIFHSLL